jgi:hypothetical protein
MASRAARDMNVHGSTVAEFLEETVTSAKVL